MALRGILAARERRSNKRLARSSKTASENCEPERRSREKNDGEDGEGGKRSKARAVETNEGTKARGAAETSSRLGFRACAVAVRTVPSESLRRRFTHAPGRTGGLTEAGRRTMAKKTKKAKAAAAKKARRKPKPTRLMNFYRMMRERKAKEDAVIQSMVERLIKIGDRQGWDLNETLAAAGAAARRGLEAEGVATMERPRPRFHSSNARSSFESRGNSITEPSGIVARRWPSC
jgi:hypothetical protein